MDYIFKDWKKALDDFKSNVEKDLDEIRQHKAEVQQIKAEIFDELNRGRYIRDEQRIVISAPEVIIGNVDKSGALLGGGSSIVLRANQIQEDGVGPTGTVNIRAASIRQIAADPGTDGNEAVVGSISEIVSQARSVTIQSNAATDVFSETPAAPTPGGVHIHADSRLELEAALSNELKKAQLEEKIKKLEQDKSAQKSAADEQKKNVDQAFEYMETLMENVEKMRTDQDEVRTNVLDIQDLNNQIHLLSPTLYNAVEEYIQKLSCLAETNRQLTSLKKEKDQIVSEADFKKNSTKACIKLRGESIRIVSEDGDGNLRDNEGAGVNIVSNKVNISAREHTGELKEKGNIILNAKTIGLSTANTKMQDDGKNGNVTTEGDVYINSKNVVVTAIDYEIKDTKPKEKALTKDGKLFVRIEKTNLSATDTEGKATGSVTVNSKAIELKSMDVNKEKRTDDKLAAGSSMLLLSEKMYAGAKDKDHKSKKLQAISEEMGLFADKTLEAQQGDAKAVLQLSEGDAAISGSKMQVFGETTLNGKTEVKNELKAPKATIDNLEAKTSFKSTNISDGIAVPGAPSTAKLNAKLKTEDAPKES